MNRARTDRRYSTWILVPLLSLCLGIVVSGRLVQAGDVYVGSETCGQSGCHTTIYNDFRSSGHPYKLVDSEKARTRPIPLPEGYSWDDISYVIGGYKWKSRYMGTDGYIITELPDGTQGMNQYNYLTRTWSDYHPGELKPYNCGSCHTTGWVADEDWETDGTLADNQDGLPGIHGTFAFGGVQCEACHGPGGHFEPIDRTAAACGACHIRGSELTIPASGGFIRHHEQWNEHLAGPHAALDCIDCHDPHKQSKTSTRATCTDCHGAIAESYAGTPMDEWNVTCEDCHMAKASKSAQALGPYEGDIMSHLFVINTDQNAKLFTEDGKFVNLNAEGKAGVTLDFACLSCHETESLAWAEIYAKDFHGGQNDVTNIHRPTRPRVRMGIFH